jgi:hypothetical protein
VKSGRGRNSLRSFLYKKCKDGNATILKFMAMNELGMKDRSDIGVANNSDDLKNFFKGALGLNGKENT